MTGTVDGLSIANLCERGLFSHPRARAQVVERFGVPGTGDASRVLMARVLGGWEFEVLASRGLDIGHASFRGIPIGWKSPITDARPLDHPSGSRWLERFTGGLLTTCGPFNIGEAKANQPMHGRFSHIPAQEVTYHGGADRVDICGAIESHELFGASVCVRRRISSWNNGATSVIRITDEIENTGPVEASIEMLYHVNLAPPIAVPGSIVSTGAQSVLRRENVPEIERPSPLPQPLERIVEAVFEHRGVPIDESGWSRAEILREGSTIRVEVAWHSLVLPKLFQWIVPTRGRWANALEPASAPLRSTDDEWPRRVLGRGETVAFEVQISAVDLSQAGF